MPPFCIVEEAQSLCDARARVQELAELWPGEYACPPPVLRGRFLRRVLTGSMFFCFISIDERRPSSQGTPTAPARTARSDRDPARFATGSPDLPSPGLPEVPSGRRPPGVGPHRWLSRRTHTPVHCASPTKATGPAVAAKLSKVASQVGSDLRAQPRIVRGRPLG